MDAATVVIGLINGSVIGLLAAGFVLVYKANRFLNIAHAQLGVVSAMLLAKLVNDVGFGFWPALVLCLPLGGIVGILVERLAVGPIRRRTSSPVRLLLLSLGLAQILLAATYLPALKPRTDTGTSFPQPFASEIEVGGIGLTGMSVLTILMVPALLLGLTWILERSAFGKQIRAAASNPQAARLNGIRTARVSTVTWGIAGVLSAVAAILSGPSATAFDFSALGPLLLVQTLGAAAFGAFVSLPWAVGGGLAIGLVYQVLLSETRNVGNAQLAIFGLILVVILLRGRAIGRVFAVSGSAVPEMPAVRIPASLRGSTLVTRLPRRLVGAVLALAVAAPLLPALTADGERFQLSLVLLYALTGVSLTVLMGWAGQVTLGHMAIVGLGGYLAARWIADGLPFLVILVLAGVAGAAAAVVVGLPAVRVRGLTLVVTTVGFAVLAPQWLYLQEPIGGKTPFTTLVGAPAIGPPGLGSIDSQLKLYYVVLAVLLATVGATVALRRTNAGRAVLAVRDNEAMSAALGLTPATVKMSVLSLSGCIAGITGVLWAVAWQRMTPVQFGPEASTAVLAIPVLGGLGSVAGALAAAVLLYVPLYFLVPHLDPILGEFGRSIGFFLLLGGLSVVGTMFQFPNGIAGFAQGRWQGYLDRRAGSLSAGDAPAADVPVQGAPDPAARAMTRTRGIPDPSGRERVQAPATPDAVPLVVEDVHLSFGGVQALRGASLEVRPEEIVGVIGPNGAGKTTLMNVISGVVRPDRGSVRAFGHEIVDLPPSVRSSFGLARSFQDAALFSGLTILETLQLAVARGHKTGFIGSLAFAPWVRHEDRRFRAEAEEIADAFGLGPWASALTADLSTGTRRICDLAVQVATNPKLVLLDEPTGGVAQREAEAFGPLVRRISRDVGCSVLIIEHDMPLLMGLCDRVCAMATGELIAEGTPAEVREDPKVIASYLGTDETAISRSGSPTGPRTAPPRRRQLTSNRSAP